MNGTRSPRSTTRRSLPQQPAGGSLLRAGVERLGVVRQRRDAVLLGHQAPRLAHRLRPVLLGRLLHLQYSHALLLYESLGLGDRLGVRELLGEAFGLLSFGRRSDGFEFGDAGEFVLGNLCGFPRLELAARSLLRGSLRLRESRDELPSLLAARFRPLLALLGDGGGLLSRQSSLLLRLSLPSRLNLEHPLGVSQSLLLQRLRALLRLLGYRLRHVALERQHLGPVGLLIQAVIRPQLASQRVLKRRPRRDRRRLHANLGLHGGLAALLDDANLRLLCGRRGHRLAEVLARLAE
mmetsp:Transcript_3653/g.14692  ORF Transcript_3653/g.14692 Transcript_3653/m.14692 type:complete len:294 (+) Transcript_3653:94-975(+)